MKQLTARSPEQVKAWVTEHPHHLGYLEGVPPNFTHLSLQGRTHRLRIPTAIKAQCKLVPSTNDDSRMFVWDEAKAGA